MTGRRRGANKRRSHGTCQRIGPIRDGHASWRNSDRVLSLGKLCEDHGYTYHWIRGQKPHLTQNGKIIDCNISNYVPFVVPGLSTVVPGLTTSSSSTSPSPTSQDSVVDVNRYTENPVQQRSGSTSEELRGDPLHETKETENKKKGNQKKYKEIYRMNLLDWLQEFWENLVDESTSSEPWRNPEQGSQVTSKSSHELPMESRAKVEPGSVSTGYVRTFRRIQIVIYAWRRK